MGYPGTRGGGDEGRGREAGARDGPTKVGLIKSTDKVRGLTKVRTGEEAEHHPTAG